MKKVIFYILIIFLLVPVVSRAQDSYTLLEPLPCIEDSGQTCKDGVVKEISLNDYIGYIFKFSIALAAFLAVIMIIWGGIQVMTSEIPYIKIEGKHKIWDAITGLLMVLASYLILATIDPRLVQINTSIPEIKISDSELQSVKNFQDQLYKDMKYLSYEAINQSRNLDAQIKTKQSRIEELEHTNTENLSPEEILELETLKDETRILKSQEAKVVGTGLIKSAYLTSMSTAPVAVSIWDNGYAKRLTEYRESVTRSKDTIDKYFDKYGQVLKDSGDNEGYQNMLLQKGFYKSQMSENEYFMSVVSNYILDPSKKELGTLNNRLDVYQKELDGLNSSTNDTLKGNSELQNEYKTLLQKWISIGSGAKIKK